MMSHDCVIVPGWGALIAQYSESFYNEDAGIINKPQRKVGFNSSVNHNDGLLAQSIVRREGITYDEAMRFIADSVTTFKQQLNADGEVSLGRLGFFHNCDGQPDFIPFFHESCNDEYFGLRSINFKTLAQMREEQFAAEDQAEAEAAAAIIEKPQQRSWARRAMQIAASVVLLLALVPVLTTPIMREDNKDLAGINLPQMQRPAEASTIVNWDSVNVDLAIALPDQAFDDKHSHRHHSKVEEEEINNQNDIEIDDKKEDILEGTSGSGRYYLVVSSLVTNKQVSDYMASHKNLKGKMHVLKRGNKLRIYVARDNDPSRLMKAKQYLPEEYSDAWVCN